ncbi:MAG: peptidase MA family metallohydrolase [Dehalococcoidia bacterium]
MKNIKWPIAVTIALTLMLLFPGAFAAADEEWASVAIQDVHINFPDDVVFSVEFTSDRPVERVVLSFRVEGRDSTRREPATVETGDTLSAEFVLKTRGGSSLFIPPGAILTYSWTFEDEDGNTVKSEPVTFIYMDTRFEWETVNTEMVTVFYNGPTQTRAETILDAVGITLRNMGAMLKTSLSRHINMVVYNNPLQMQEVFPFVSKTTSSGLITLGQAYYKEGVILIMGSDRRIRGTASHEMSHILIAEAGEGPGVRLPAWLNEGLSEIGNLEPGTSYDLALLMGVREDRLLPITHMISSPGTPEDAIMLYGQSRNIVKFMIETYGQPKLAELLRLYKNGSINIDDALMQIYGFDQVKLDNLWRDSIGLPPLSEGRTGNRPVGDPTPIPTRVPLGAPTPAIAPTPEAPPEPTGELSTDSEGLAILQDAYGARTGDPAFVAAADLNADGVINYIDLAILGSGYTGP